MVVSVEEGCPCADLARRFFREAGFPLRYCCLTLADLEWAEMEPLGLAASLQNYAAHLREYLAEGIGLVLHGPVGTGKTHAAVGVGKAACAFGIQPVFLTIADFLDEMRRTYDPSPQRHAPHRAPRRDADVLAEWADVALLILDDLGHQNITPWAMEKLYELINRRYLNQSPTIVTTNYAPERLALKLNGNGDRDSDGLRVGESIVSRLCGDAVVLEFEGRDYREKLKRQRLKTVQATFGETGTRRA